MRSILVALALAGATLATPQTAPHLPALDAVLPARAAHIYAQLTPRLDMRGSVEVLAAMAPLWRLAGNPAFELSQQRIANHLQAAGLATRYISYPNSGHGWEPRRGSLRLDGPDGEEVLSQARDRVTLAINSFATAAAEPLRPLVDVGAGTAPGDYEGRDVTGAVVLASGAIGQVWTEAVKTRGAAGVISTELADYTRPADTPDVLQWGSIPYDEGRRSFGFKASPRAAAVLRARLAAGPVRVQVAIDTVFHARPNRTLVTEIPGRVRPQERVVLVAHVQEPGANDNASGCATLMAVALAIRDAVVRGVLPAPERTLTFLWVDEIRGSRQWANADAARLKQVLAMMSLDMTGADTAVTGGTFLIEKSPDPSALWERPSDPHSEWGAGEVDRALVRGSFLNDLHLAVALRRAADTGWVVRTNPYEGGSDHTVFAEAGVPALLNWHFTDRYYHTNLDMLDKTSVETMRNVASVAATTALFLASANGGDVVDMARLMEAAAVARFETERAQEASPEILEAWRTWYVEAVGSVTRLGSGVVPPTATAAVEAARVRVAALP